jgi:hypothetical protein
MSEERKSTSGPKDERLGKLVHREAEDAEGHGHYLRRDTDEAKDADAEDAEGQGKYLHREDDSDAEKEADDAEGHGGRLR